MRLGCLVFILFVFFYSTQLVQAATPSPSAGTPISLSEVFACQDSTHPEWIEFFNSSGSDIDLSTWKVERKSTGDWNTPKPLNATISANTYMKFDFSNYLNDSGFFLRVKDNTGTVVETFPDSDTASKCPSGNSLVSWIKQGISWSVTSTLTPAEANILTPISTPQPTPTTTPSPQTTPSATPTPAPAATTQATAITGLQPTSISLSEVYACQNDDEREWVELYNSANTSVTITSWKLTDDDHNDQPIASLSIAANGYSVVEIAKYTKGMLTNSGDVVNLIDATGKTVESFPYKSCTKGSSWAKRSGNWQESTSITKGAANPSSQTSATTTPQAQGQLQGDGGDIRVASAYGAEESSPSGYVLGTQDSENSEQNSPIPTTNPTESRSSNSKLAAFVLIGAGIVIISASCGYYGWTVWKKRRINV